MTLLVNGSEIYFEVHGSGEPVILLHGFLGSGANWLAAIAQWSARYRLIVPDLRGHGRSSLLTKPFRHKDAAADMLALLDYLQIARIKGVGISGGANVLLQMAAMQPSRVEAMVLVSSTPYFPTQARSIMSMYADNLSEEQLRSLRELHPGGDLQIRSMMASTRSFAESHDDMDFTPPMLAAIRARTLIVQGDRDPLYPVQLSVDMAQAIPQSNLWIVPDAGHGPVLGKRWNEFLATAFAFLGR